jgi:DNA-binding HxlR family transcriptional regulator
VTEAHAAPPSWADYDPSNCSVAAAVSVLSDRWTWLILREAFQGTTRFEVFQQRLGISRDVLAARLKHLVSQGVLRLEPYRSPGSRTRQEYRLTRAGVELQPALIALLNWADDHLRDPEERALVITHSDCGAPVRAVLRCEEGHDVPPYAVDLRPGPGAQLRHS